MRPRRFFIGLAVLPALAVPLFAAGQREGVFGRFGQYENVPYDGRFTFTRIQYARYRGWAADYPTMERNLRVILQDITSMIDYVIYGLTH